MTSITVRPFDENKEPLEPFTITASSQSRPLKVKEFLFANGKYYVIQGVVNVSSPKYNKLTNNYELACTVLPEDHFMYKKYTGPVTGPPAEETKIEKYKRFLDEHDWENY